jgi:branched-chain amino acid transport system substrate-binding protein
MLTTSAFRRGLRRFLIASTAIVMPSLALADINVGIILPATGSTAALGIPMKNALALAPATIGGEKVNYIMTDDASDPGSATSHARRLITEDKVDVIIGSGMTGAAIAVAGVAFENEVPQLSTSPIPLPPGRDTWTFRMPQNVKLMVGALLDHMKTKGVKTVGFIGFTDAWGDQVLNDFKSLLGTSGISVIAEERYARADTSVTGQVLKVLSAKPDVILVGASGTAAALPEIALRERGFKGQIYQSHGAVSLDMIRIGGAAVEGTILASGPVVVAEQLPDSSPVKKAGLDFIAKYDEKYGAGSRNQFSAHSYDAILALMRVLPVALKSAKPGTKEFRAAIKTALETEKNIVATHGVYNFTKDDHFGLDTTGRVLITIEGGKWKLMP